MTTLEFIAALPTSLKTRKPLVTLAAPTGGYKDRTYTAKLDDGTEVRVQFKSTTCYKMSGRLRLPSKTRYVVTLDVLLVTAEGVFIGSDVNGHTLGYGRSYVGEGRTAQEKVEATKAKITDLATAVFGLTGNLNWKY